jgi:hypothetical protein
MSKHTQIIFESLLWKKYAQGKELNYDKSTQT